MQKAEQEIRRLVATWIDATKAGTAQRPERLMEVVPPLVTDPQPLN